jgi:hypothetical protein
LDRKRRFNQFHIDLLHFSPVCIGAFDANQIVGRRLVNLPVEAKDAGGRIS